MVTTKRHVPVKLDIKEPLNLNSKTFNENKYACYQWLREEAPLTDAAFDPEKDRPLPEVTRPVQPVAAE